MARGPESVEEWDQYFEEEWFIFVRQSTIDGYKQRIKELEARYDRLRDAYEKKDKELANAQAHSADCLERMEGMVPREEVEGAKAYSEQQARYLRMLEEKLADARAEILELRKVLGDDNVLIRSLGEGLFKAEVKIEKLRRKAVWCV